MPLKHKSPCQYVTVPPPSRKPFFNHKKVPQNSKCKYVQYPTPSDDLDLSPEKEGKKERTKGKMRKNSKDQLASKAYESWYQSLKKRNKN